MKHQDKLTKEMVEGFVRGIFPEHEPLQLTRFHSENNQVYRIKGEATDVVLKIEGKGHTRSGAILREVETIESLRGRAKVPQILTCGYDPRPYLILPFYHSESNDRVLMDRAIADHLTRLADIRSLSSTVIINQKSYWKNWLQIVLGRATTDQRFSAWLSSIEALSDGLDDLLGADCVIYGQPQPGEVILTNGDYVVIDWSEGLAPCLIGWQIACLTFYTAINNYDAAIQRVSFFRNAIERFPIRSDVVYAYWLIYCIHVGWWLAGQKKDDQIVAEFMNYLQQLTVRNKAKHV